MNLTLITEAVLGCHTEVRERELERFESAKAPARFLSQMRGMVAEWVKSGYVSSEADIQSIWEGTAIVSVIPVRTAQGQRAIGWVRHVNPDGTCEVEFGPRQPAEVATK